MKKIMSYGLGSAMALLATWAVATPPSATPVGVIGGGGYCESIGEVRGLKADGDGFLAVRAGPGAGHALLDRLGNGHHLRLCRSEGRWVSVLYPAEDSKERHCAAESPDISKYRGPCKSGWVHWNWVQIFAG